MTLVQGYGTITHDLTWAKDMGLAGSSYMIVDEDAELTILKGVETTWNNAGNNHKLLVYGKLVANGGLMNPIIFQPSNPTGDNNWGGLSFTDESDDQSSVTFCEIYNAVFGVLMNQACPTVSNNWITECAYGLYSMYGDRDPWYIYNNSLDICTIGTRTIGSPTAGNDLYFKNNDYIDTDWYAFQFQTGSTPNLWLNDMQGSGTYGLWNQSSSNPTVGSTTDYMSGSNTIYDNGTYEINNDVGGVTIKAENNYWGPSGPNRTMFDGSVDYTPYLEEEDEDVGVSHMARRLPQKPVVPEVVLTPSTISNESELNQYYYSLLEAGSSTSELKDLIYDVYRLNESQSVRNAAEEMYLGLARYGGDPDEMLAGYKNLLLNQTIDEGMKKRSLLTMGEICLLDKYDEDGARRYFRVLADEYPDDPLTALAWLDIGESEKAHAIIDKLKAAGESPGGGVVTDILLQNYPNPFNPETEIRFNLKDETAVILGIYNIQGRLVRTLVEKKLPAGLHRVHWDGRDEHSIRVPSGVYFMRLRAGATVRARKMVLVK